ncbi:MAG: ABC transporter ATP-binding protein [Phycisphaerales bacterium JB043]
MIRVENLSKRFAHIEALRDVSFEAPSGRVVGLLGPNGAGKSTTMRILAGLIPPTNGHASINGLDSVEDSLASRRCLGYLPESPALYPEMRVASFLRFRAMLFGLSGKSVSQAVDDAIQRCWLEGVTRQRIASLSKGFRQRVGIASTLLHDPPALMLDEPINGLDPEQISLARQLIRELGKTKAVLFSSHILSEVEAVCDDIVIIAHGRLLAKGSMRDVLTESTSTRRYHLEVSSQHARPLLDRITSTRHVVHVEIKEHGDDWHKLLVDASQDADDLREMLAQSVHELGALARELRSDTPTLESRYMQLLREVSQ